MEGEVGGPNSNIDYVFAALIRKQNLKVETGKSFIKNQGRE
jgi:hypothetical protein